MIHNKYMKLNQLHLKKILNRNREIDNFPQTANSNNLIIILKVIINIIIIYIIMFKFHNKTNILKILPKMMKK